MGSLQGSHEAAIAGFVASAIQGREQALTLASRLIPRLPAAGRRQVAGVVAQVSNADAGQALRLAGAIPAGSVACDSADAVSSLDQLVQSLIGDVLPSVGPGAAPSSVKVPDPVSSLLGQVVSILPALGGGLLALGS